jgi:RNA polymerase sigma factor (sigma-70 family)
MEARRIAQWYQTCGPELMLYARHLTGDLQAEDLVHEAFIRLLGQGTCPENVRAWLFCVVRNEAMSLGRRLRLRYTAARVLGQEARPWFEAGIEDRIDAQTVQALMHVLPDHLREIVLLRIWGQLSLQEVSRIVGKPVSTVHHWYQEALETLRQRLESSSCAKNKD